MKIKKILLMIISLALIQSIFILANFSVAQVYEIETVYSYKDAHIYNAYPNNNYGDWEEMYCGNWVASTSPVLRKNMAYISFNLMSIPSGWDKVELLLRVSDIPKAFDLDMGIVHEYWSESLITWNNRPLNITWQVKSLNFTIDGVYVFNITNLISSSDYQFNMMLYDQHTEDEVNVLISAREYPYVNSRPQLHFYYEVPDTPFTGDTPAIPGFPLCSLGFILIFSIVFMVWKSKKSQN